MRPSFYPIFANGPNFSHLQEVKTTLSSFEDGVCALEEDKNVCPIILYATPGLSILTFLYLQVVKDDLRWLEERKKVQDGYLYSGVRDV